MITFLSYLCLALLYAESVLLAAVAGRKASGRPTGELHTAKWAWRLLAVEIVLLLGTAPMLYRMTRGEALASWVIIIGLVVFSLPTVLSVIYYLSVFGDWTGVVLYGDDSPPMPGAEAPELDRAKAAAARGDLAGAVAQVEEFLAGQPDNLEALDYLALLLFKQGDYDRSAQAARRALSRDAEVRLTNTGLIEELRVDLLALLADALERAGRPEEAAAALEDAVPFLTVERYRQTLGERAQRLRAKVGGGVRGPCA